MASPRISRRTLLRAAAVAVAAGSAGAGGALLLDRGGDGPTAVRRTLRKGVSMGGPVLVHPGHPNDYLLHGNREFLRESGTDWVKLWVSWEQLAGGRPPRSRSAHWRELATAAEGAITGLDRQVRAANDDGLAVMLTVYQGYPQWASGLPDDHPERFERPHAAAFPDDLSPDGPWAWFLEWLLRRYSPDGPENPIGARVDVLEPLNEPNFAHWPQSAAVAATARMIGTASALRARAGGPRLLAPALSDHPDPGAEPKDGTDWRTFAAALLAELAAGGLEGFAGFSMHNYRDVKYGGDPSRAEQVIGLLEEREWLGAGRRLWLTEGGYVLDDPGSDAEQRLQAELIEQSFEAMRALAHVHLWTQHSVNDVPGNDFKSALRADFDYDRGGPGPARPSWHLWGRL